MLLWAGGLVKRTCRISTRLNFRYQAFIYRPALCKWFHAPAKVVYSPATASRSLTSSSTLAVEHLPGVEVESKLVVELLPDLIAILGARKGPSLLEAVKRSPRLVAILADSKTAVILARAMVNTPYPHYAGFVLSISHRLLSTVRPSAYEGVAERLASAKKWHLIPPITTLCRRQTGQLTVRLLNWQILAYMQSSKFVLMEKTLGDFYQLGRSPNRRTYHLLISGHIRNHDVRQAQITLQNMEVAGFVVDASTHAALVSAYRTLGPDAMVRSRALASAQSASTEMTLSTVILNGLLQMCLDVHDLPGALTVLRQFHWRHRGRNSLTALENGDTATTITTSTTAYGNLQDASDAQQVAISSTPADVATFTILVEYFARHSNLSKALGGLREMISAGILPDDVALSALIRAYVASNQIEDAVHLLASMCPDNIRQMMSLQLSVNISDCSTSDLPIPRVRPTIAMFNALLEGLVLKGGIRSMLPVLRILEGLGLHPDAKTADIFVSQLSGPDAVRPRETMRIVGRLWGPHLKPTAHHALLVLLAIIRTERAALFGVGWDNTYNVVNGVPRKSQASQAKRLTGNADLLDPIAGLSFPPFVRKSQIVTSSQRYLARHGIRTDRAAFALRMKRDAVNRADFHSAEEIMRIMVARGLHPNEYHYSALMEGYAISGDVKHVREVMAAATRHGIRINTVMFTILITAYARAGNPRGANLALREMLHNRCQADVAAIDALVSAYFAVGAFRTARTILLRLWSLVAPVPDDLKSASLKTLAQSFRRLDPRNDDHVTKQLKQVGLYRPLLQRVVARWRRSHHPQRTNHCRVL